MEPEELRDEIRKTRSLTDGIVGVNVLFAVNKFADLVKMAITEKIDLVVSGAGFSRDRFGWGRESGTPIVPVVSSAKLAVLAQKMGAAAVVVEGKEAGGHLGTDRPMRDILPEVRAAVGIPVIGAGGVIDGYDIARTMRLGADGVQMGTRFAASFESNASEEFKRMYVEARPEDVVLVHSPVGLPGQGLRNRFFTRIESGEHRDDSPCQNCLKRCSHSFCIMDALVNANRNGNSERALIFCGECVDRIHEILSVPDIFRNLLREAALA
jgi:NAD(P)H-dependent flavin oxidoreductase YrpB (nitropropane dioxygenase family)